MLVRPYHTAPGLVWSLAGLGVLLVAFALTLKQCSEHKEPEVVPAPAATRAQSSVRSVDMIVTAYCPCRQCCHWRIKHGKAVTSSGKPKIVGQTASGKMASYGTVAADTTLYPFGTKLYIPGYGYGIVEDRGADITGNRLDVFFHSHDQARAWGCVRQVVAVVRTPHAGEP